MAKSITVIGTVLSALGISVFLAGIFPKQINLEIIQSHDPLIAISIFMGALGAMIIGTILIWTGLILDFKKKKMIRGAKITNTIYYFFFFI
ncbi:MAG: hypothetical protein ACHQYP_10045, partial [Nitrospiria bacterium]